MKKLKDRMVELIKDNAQQKVADLSCRYAQAKSEDKEAIQAGIEFERWLAESCRIGLQ